MKIVNRILTYCIKRHGVKTVSNKVNIARKKVGGSVGFLSFERSRYPLPTIIKPCKSGLYLF